MKRFFKRSHIRYLAVIASVMLPVSIILLLNIIVLWKAGEMEKSRDIATRLQEGNVIYESGVHDLRKELPLHIIKERKPKIIAFGSSRPLDFRQEYFTETFACACQAMSQIDDGMVYAEALLSEHVPETVIFALDFWWFQDSRQTRPPRIDYEDAPRIDLKKIIKPFFLLADGTISWNQYFKLLLAGDIDIDLGTDRKEGLLAKVRGIGKRADGSLFLGLRLTDGGFDYYAKYADQFANPDAFIAGSDRYGPDLKIYDDRIQTLRDIVSLFHEKGVKVVLVLPPIAPNIYKALDLETAHRRFIELPGKLKGIGDEFYDFHDPDKTGASACEFADPHHAGDTAYMRLLLAMAGGNRASVINSYIDKDMLSRSILAFEGLTIADFNQEYALHQERDFLRLGCARKMKDTATE